MKTKGWHARAWHRKHLHRGLLGRGGTGRVFVTVGLVGLLTLATGAVALAHNATDDETPSARVGICHATGSALQPHVFLVVDRGGAEYAHHVQHPGDFIDVTSEAECAPSVASSGESETDAADDGEQGCPFENPAADLSEEAPPKEGTSEDDLPEQAEPVAPAPPQTVVEPSSEPAETCAADIALTQTGVVVGRRVVFTSSLVSLGPDEANDVRLAVQLPDTGRAWRLEGPGAAACTLAERRVACDFGDLQVGESRTVSASALHCAHDCGEDLAAAGRVAAFNDENATNDAAASFVEIPDCPRRDEAAPVDAPLEAAPPAPAPPPNSEPPAADAGSQAPTSNGTTPEPSATPGAATPTNETDAGNASEPEPETADVRASAVATQDDVEVLFTIRVSSLGPASATGVTLSDLLPDVRRPWHLGGPDADACLLEGRALSCWFGDLEAGSHRTLSVKAYTDRLACGHHFANTVLAAAGNDAQAANNRSTTGIEAPPC